MDRRKCVMRKLIVIVVILLVMSLVGCHWQEANPVKNDVFTDEFFNGIESISLLMVGTASTREQMDPVIHYLSELNLTRMDNFNGKGEPTVGGLIILGYADEKPKTLFVTTEFIEVNIQGVHCYYQAEGKNIYQDLVEIFSRTGDGSPVRSEE